jgi:hypothetical protein
VVSYRPRVSRPLTIVLCLLGTLVAGAPAGASPGLAVGAVENLLMWQTADTVAVARHLGLRTLVVSLDWESHESSLGASDASRLTNVVMGAGGIRIVLGLHNSWQHAPIDRARRERYCGYAADALRRFPQVNDIIIWNEPNVSFFWQPQFDAGGASASPRGYFELLSHCYDVLHAVRPGVNVIGPVNSHWGNDNPNAFSNITHSPPRFIRALGTVYRGSGRTQPLFDTLGHHPYPRSSDEHPSIRHADEALISIGDTDRLLTVMQDAFGGTGQRIPQDGLPIWYLETGYQTTIRPEKAGAYVGVENWPGPVPDLAPGAAVDQARQLADSLRLMYCQQHVEAIFNFLLRDEPDLAGWQSGVFWADGSPKASLDAYRSVIQEINDGRVDCAGLRAAPAGAPAAPSPTFVPGVEKVQRSVTRITYRGPTNAQFGSLRMRARLMRGAVGSKASLHSRQVTFAVGGATYLTTTDARGIASVAPVPPTNPGRHRVEIRFRGDESSLGSAARVTVSVTNTRGRVESKGQLHLSATLRGSLHARSDGRSARGILVLRSRNAVRRIRLTALGVARRGLVAWLSGSSGRNRYDVQARRLAGGRVRVQIWRNDVVLHRPAVVPGERLRIVRG